MDFKTPGILQDAGVLIAITTDHPVTRIQYLPICAGFAAKEGLGVEHALEAITCNPAKICGVSDRIGSIERAKMRTWPFMMETPWRCSQKLFILL